MLRAMELVKRGSGSRLKTYVSFAVIVIVPVLGLISIISACCTLVKPGGDVFFSTINRNPKSFLFAIVGAEYVLNMLPKGTHDYDKLITPAELSGFCRSADLRVEDLTGMTYNPITKTYKLGNNVDVNYIAHARPE